jgi:hypothetical protein
MFPPKIHLIPTFWKPVLSSANFTNNLNLGTKVKIEVQTRGEMGMTLWISLIWCFQQCKLFTSKSILYYYYNFVLPTKYLCIKISLPIKLCCPKTNYVWLLVSKGPLLLIRGHLVVALLQMWLYNY